MPSDPYLTNISSTQKDPYLSSVVDNVNYGTGRNRKEVTSEGYDIGSLFRQMDFNASTGSSMAENQYKQGIIDYLKGTVLQYSSEGRQFDVTKKLQDAILINSFTGRDIANDILPNYDHYMKIYTGADTGKGILGSFKDYFEAYDMQKSINNMTLALMDIGYDDPRRAYYEKQLDTARTNYALKIADVSNTSEFWKKVASSGNIVAQSVDQMMKTMTASIIAGVAGGAVAGSLYGGQGVAGNLMQSIAVEESMKKASLATAVGYTATVMTQAEASEIAETLMGMVDDNGRHIPLDIIKDYAYTFGLLSSVVELGDEMITPIGRYKIGDLTISEALNEVRDLVKSYPLGYVGLGLAGTTAEAVQEGAQGMIRQTGIDLAIKKSNERGVTSFDTGTDEDEARNKWNVGWEEFKESIIPMGVSQLLTGGLSIGASYTTAALSRPMSLTPQMRADANRYFNAGTGKVYDIGYADTAGEGPVNRFASSSASEGAQVQQKASPVLFYVNRQTGALVPLYKSDKQYLEYLREQGVTGFRGIQVNENILEQASSVGSARNVASLLANILDRGQVVGYDGSEIVFDSQESVERAKEFIDMFRGSLFGGDEFVFQGDVNITGNDDGTYTFMFEDNNGRTRRFSFRVQNENDSVVEAVRNEDGQTERTGNINPVYNQMEAELSKSGDLFRKSLTEAFEDKELEDSAKFFISQITGMDAKELDQLWDSDYQAVIDRLPEGVDMNVIEQGARFMPLLSQITGRSVQDLFSDKDNRIVLTYGKAKTVIDKNGKKRKVRGGLDHDIDPDTGVNTYTIRLTDMASGDGGDTLVHELMHLARALASPERLSGFVGLKGYTGKYGGMWESDIKRTKDGRFLLGARYYDSYGQALALVRDNEEKFVEDFFRYLRTGQAPNAQVATFFGQLKQFLQSFRNAYDRELDQETKNAFDMLLNGELYVQPGQTLKEAVETSEATLTDNVASQWEANDYSEEEGLDAEGNPLYSLQRATSAETSVPNQIPKGYGSGMDYLRNWAKRSFDADIFNPGQTNFEQGMGISDTATRYLAERKGIESLGTDPFNRTREYNDRVASMAMDRKSDTSSAMNVLNVIDDDEAMELVIAQSALALKDGGVAVFQIFHGDQTGEGRYKKENAQYQRNMRGEEYVPHVEKFYNKVEAKGDYILAQDPKMDAVNKVTGGRFDFSVAEYGAVGKPFKNANGSTISRSKYGVGKQVGNQIYVHREYASDVIPAGLIEKAEALLPEGFEYNTLMYDTKRPEVLRFDQAPDFDTAREPIPGDMVTVNTETGEVKRSHSDQIWHHKWEWVKNDYMGFNVKESYDWSKKWTSKIKDVNGIGSRRVWEEKLSKAGLKADREVLYSLSSEIRSQSEEIIAKYKDTDQWLKAPNGKPTNLTERQWVMVRTPNFIRWFGDWINDPGNASKVVDENGEPLVVNHISIPIIDNETGNLISTNSDVFSRDAYENGFWFSDNVNLPKDLINGFAPFSEDYMTYGFLNIREPLIVDAGNQRWNWMEVGEQTDEYEEGYHNIYSTEGLANYAEDNGYDGLIIKNVKEGSIDYTVTDYAAFASNQIKSATDNNGDFSSGNDSILYSLASDRQWQVMDANTQRRIDADYDRTYNEYYGTDKWMKAPNGQPTNLTERQWVQVRTPAFKEWFGDWEDDPSNASKILDENGEPLVVYHGTMESFEVFDAKKGRSSMDIQGMFFSPWELDAKGYGTNVRAFFLNIKNPANFATGFSALSKYKGKMYAGINAREDLIATGYDGVNNDNEEFIAFNPNQIKSATDNNGAFSRDNDSILFSLAPAVGTEEFDQWFNGSKVVDGQGNPLVVYHGSPVRGIDEFNADNRINGGEGLIYATDSEAVAEGFSQEFTQGSSFLRNRPTGRTGQVYPVYMDIRSPLDFRNLSEAEKNLIALSNDAISARTDSRQDLDRAYEAGNDQYVKFLARDIISNLPQYGYDGIIARMGEGDALEFGAVNADQVKRVAPEDMLYSVAYHGSGASFDEFLRSKIGSGEGVQSFGDGFYFSEADLIAKDYARDLAYTANDLNDEMLEIEQRRRKHERKLNELLEQRDTQIGRRYKKELEEEIDQARKELDYDLKGLDRLRNTETNKRNLYKVEIPDRTYDYGIPEPYFTNNYLIWDGWYKTNELGALINALRDRIEDEDEKRYLEETYGLRPGERITGEQLYNSIATALGGADKASDFLADMGYIGNMYKAGQIFGLPAGVADAWNYVIYPKNKDSIRILEHWAYDTDAEAEELHSLTPEQETRAMQELDSYPEEERNRIASNFERLNGTPWHREAMKALVIRSDMRALMEGRELPPDSVFRDPEYNFKRQEDALRRGIDGIYEYLTVMSFISDPKKCVHAINSSLLNCNPSLECAKFCYASEGNFIYWQSIIKSEMVTKAVESDPVRAARIIARQYKATTDFMVGETLRIFDKGDFSEQYVTLIKELNRMEIPVQVFSKRPEFLRQIQNGVNVAMLSIDKSNRELADQNPDMAIATVYSGRVDLEFIEANAKRYSEHGGVILPVKLGRRLLSKQEIMALPQDLRTRYTCPIDAGTKKLKEWNCKKCDINGTGGCFYKNTSESRKYKIYASIQDMNTEAINGITREITEVLDRWGVGPDSEEFRRSLANIHLHYASKLAGIDPGTERTGVSGDAEDSESGDGLLHSLTAEENNGIVDDFVAQYPETEVIELDGVKYVRHSNDAYTVDELRSIKDSVSETLHSLKLQPELDFSGQLELDFNGDQNNGPTTAMGQRWNAGGATGAPVADLRGLRPGVARYFDWSRGWNGQEPSTAINDQWDNLGYISFIGAEFRTPEDLAKLYSVYRNPKLEYSHIILTKGDTVRAHIALSTGVPFSAYAVPLGGLRYVYSYMSRIGADGYYLMHNHPSGDIDYSSADKSLSLYFEDNIPGFRGHIILDHDKFGFFDEHMKFSKRKAEGMHEASEEKLTSGFKETYLDLEKSFGAIYTRSMNEPTFSIFYMDYRGKLIEIEDLTDIPTRDYVRDKMKAGFHSYAVAFTNDRSLFEKMRAMAVSAKPKYNFLYVLYVDPDSAEHIEYFGKNSLYPYFNDNVWGYVKGSKNKSGEAFIPKFQHDDDTGTLYSLSPERQSEIIQQRKAEIQRAVEAGIFVRTEYLNEFRGEDWVQDELNLRDWMQDNPDVVTIAKDSGSFEDFKRRMTGKEETAGGDADDVPFGEEGLTEEYGDEIPFDEDFGEEEQALSDSWLERIYSYSKALSSKERDRQFANEWTSSEDKTLELARTLANYSDAFFKPKPKSRSGGYWYTKNVWGAFKGVSTKLLRLNDGTGFRGKKQGRSTSSEIQEVQNLIRQNPRAYRNAYTTVMMAESRAGQVKAGMQTGIGSDADWMRFEMIDDDIAQELERIEAESEEATATRKAGVDYKTKYEDLKRKMRDAQRDLEKANEGLKTSVANLRSQLDLARANESALRNSLAEAEKDIASAEKEYSDLIERLGGKIEALEEQNAEYRERARKARQLEKQLEERRARVKELRSQLTGANREVRRLTNAVSARDRYIEAKKASDYRNKRIRQILSATEFNPSTLDASFEESLNWVAGLFERDEEVMEGRRTVSELIAVLKRDIEMADLNGEDVTEKRQQLIELQRKKKESAWKEPPAQLASYLPEGYVLRADNRPSMWSAQELDVLLGALRLMRADARQMLEQKQNERMNRLNEVSYGYFRQAFGRDADMDEEGEMSSSALRDDLLANIAEKDFNPVKERYLSYHLYKAKIQRLARLIDGDREGVVYDWFVRRNYDCQTNELRGINRRLDLGDTVWRELGLKNGELSKEGFKGTKENGTPYSLTRGQMIGVYVYSQSQLGYEKLTSLSGNGIKAEDISAITGGLTEKERAWGDFLLAEMQSNYRRLADTFYNVWNQNLGQRPAYFPLVSSESKTIRAEDADFLCGQVSGKDGKAYVDKGFTKECNPNALYPLKLDVTATWNQQVRRQEHFIAYGEWARDSQYLLDHGQLGEEIKRAKGNPFYRELNRMTNHVISNYITTGTDFDRTISKYFSARNAAALTASISTALKQAGSIGAVFADDIAFRKLFTGEGFFRNFLKANEELNAEYGDVKDVREFIYYNAPDIRNRRVDFEVMAYLNRVYGGAVSNAIQRTTNKIMKYTTNAVDRAVVERLWLGRYYTEFENLTKKGMSQRQAHKEAVFRASQLISETQPTSMRMDQSGLQIEAQKSSLLRMISVFTNQAMNTANMILMDVPREIRNRNWKKVVGTAVAVAVNVGIVALVSGRFVKKGDEDDGEYAWRLARELLGTVAQTVDPVWGGNLLGGIMYAYSKNSYLSEFSEIGGVLRNLMTPNTKKTKWQKWADALETLGGEALNVMGIPGGNLINRPLKAIQNENAGYLLNSTWGQIVESYR